LFTTSADSKKIDMTMLPFLCL